MQNIAVPRELDKSAWPAQAARREKRFAQWKREAKAKAEWEASPAGEAYAAARAAHPLAGALEQATDASLDRSREARYRLKIRRFDNGHAEAVVTTEYPNPQRTLERAIALDCRALARRGEGDREASIERAVRRAKQEVRLLCKTMAVNSLWTLTFRQCVTDRDVALRCLDAFRRRVIKVLGEWRYVATLEKQERGAWHIHLATHALPTRLTDGGVKVKSWDVMRKIWLSCAGDLGGNFDEAKRSRRWSGRDRAVRGTGAIARYIASYVAKDMVDCELNRKRYSSSRGTDIPDAYIALFSEDEATMHSLVVSAFGAVGQRVTSTWFDAKRGVFFIESDDSGNGG
jgi:hypothetical protein